VRRPCETVGNGEAAGDDGGASLRIDAVEHADVLAVGAAVHAADEERAVGADLAVVEPRRLRLVITGPQIAPAAAVGIEHDHLAGERDDERAAFAKAERGHLLVEGPAAAGAVGKV